MRKVLSALLALMMVLSLACAASADGVEINEAGVFPVVKNGEGIKLVIGVPAQATVTDYDDNHYTNYLREKMGIEIEIKKFDASEYMTQLQLMTTSNETLPDVLIGFGFSADQLESYGTQGYLVDLMPYFEAHELTHYFDTEAMSYLSESEKAVTLSAGRSSNGALYAFPMWAQAFADPWSDGFLINNTFLAALDMEMPTTLDELYDYLVAVKTQDPNGNGIADEIPMVGYNGQWGYPVLNIVNSYVFLSNQNTYGLLNCDDDGNIYAPYMTEEFHDALRFCAKLYEEGLLSDLSFTQDMAALKAMIDVTGDTPDVAGVVAAHRSFAFVSHNSAERRTHYTSMGPLEGPDGVAYCPTHVYAPNYHNAITTACEYPEVAFALLDFMTGTESSLVARYGREGEYWNWATEEEKARGCALADIGITEVIYGGGTSDKIIWGQANNEIWNITDTAWLPVRFMSATAAPLDSDYASDIAKYNVEDWQQAIMKRYGKAPKNLVGEMAFTQEEKEKIGNSRGEIGNYVWKCMTLMTTGQMNVETQWDEFQNNVKAMGLDTLIEVTQDAWDRVNG